MLLKFDVDTVPNDILGGWMAVLEVRAEYAAADGGKDAGFATIVLGTNPRYSILSFVCHAE